MRFRLLSSTLFPVCAISWGSFGVFIFINNAADHSIHNLIKDEKDIISDLESLHLDCINGIVPLKRDMTFKNRLVMSSATRTAQFWRTAMPTRNLWKFANA